MKSNKFWLVVLGVAVLVSAVTALLLGRAPVSYAHIYHNSVLTDSVNLAAVTESFAIVVESADGFNMIDVERGRIRVSRADCPDGICVRQGWVSSGVIPLVCLPNRLVIMLEGAGADVDAVVG